MIFLDELGHCFDFGVGNYEFGVRQVWLLSPLLLLHSPLFPSRFDSYAFGFFRNVLSLGLGRAEQHSTLCIMGSDMGPLQTPQPTYQLITDQTNIWCNPPPPIARYLN